MKLGLPCFVLIMRRQDSLEKTIMLGKVEGSRKRGRRVNSLKKTTGAEQGCFRIVVKGNLMAHNEKKYTYVHECGTRKHAESGVTQALVLPCTS